MYLSPKQQVDTRGFNACVFNSTDTMRYDNWSPAKQTSSNNVNSLTQYTTIETYIVHTKGHKNTKTTSSQYTFHSMSSKLLIYHQNAHSCVMVVQRDANIL